MSVTGRWVMCLFGVIASLSPLVNSQAGTAERVLWDKTPITVHIQRNHERIIHFPDEIRYWLPDKLQRKVTVLAANGVLYIRALQVFPRTRIRVQGLTSHQLYLLDVSASDAASVSEELIVLTPESVVNKTKNVSQLEKGHDWRVRLTRYAAQQLYAPERLLGGDTGIKRIPVNAEDTIALIRGGTIEVTPVASWQGGGFTVTAVRLQNKLSHSLSLGYQPSDTGNTADLSHLIRGDWLTLALQHRRLGVAGASDDTTTLYLVSDRPFVESAGVLPPRDMESQKSESTGDGTDG